MDGEQGQAVLEKGAEAPKEPERIVASAGSFNPYPNLARLTNWHLTVIELMLEGLKEKEIAERLDCAVGSIKGLIGSPLFENELSRRRSELQKRSDEVRAVVQLKAMDKLYAKLEYAADKQVQLLDDGDPKVRQVAINQIMDRCYNSNIGLANLEKANGQGSVLMVNVNQLQNLQIAVRETQQLLGAKAVTAPPAFAATAATTNAEQK